MSTKIQYTICFLLLVGGVLSSSENIRDKAFFYTDYFFSDHSIEIDNIIIKSSGNWVLESMINKGRKGASVHRSGLNHMEDFFSIHIDHEKILPKNAVMVESNNSSYSELLVYELKGFPKENLVRFFVVLNNYPVVFFTDNLDKVYSFLGDENFSINYF